MADNNAIAQKSQQGWKAFCSTVTYSTVAIIIALILMAMFLL